MRHKPGYNYRQARARQARGTTGVAKPPYNPESPTGNRGGGGDDSGHWVTINGHRVFIQSGGPGAQKGHIEPSPHAPSTTPPSTQDMSNQSNKYFEVTGFEYT